MNYSLWFRVSFLICFIAGNLRLYAQIPANPGKESTFLNIEMGRGVLSIYYRLNSQSIPEAAVPYIDQVVGFMKDHPGAVFELCSHTDSQGNSAYNLSLSQGRAEAFLAYLSGKGIDRNRLAVQSYGESQLINHCKDGIHCTEAEHLQNRRIEWSLQGISE